MNMEIKPSSCRECPFCGEEYEQKVCNLIPWYGGWVDDKGFQELYEENILPESCPLRNGEVIVTLVTKVTES